MIFTDKRLPDAIKLIVGSVSKTDLMNSYIVIDSYNVIHILVRETALYSIPIYSTVANTGFDNIGFTYGGLIGVVDPNRVTEYIPDNEALKKVLPIVSVNYYNTKTNMVAREENLQENPIFNTLTARKSSDGNSFYHLIGIDPTKVYFIPIFAGFPNLNKKDSVNITVYKIANGNCIVEMDIFKTKIKKSIKLIYSIIDMC